MGRPFRHYLFRLAERFGMPVREVLRQLNSREISEWMAYDLTHSPDFQKRYKRDQEAEMLKKETPEQILARFKKMLPPTKR